jgi:hypothetical protein
MILRMIYAKQQEEWSKVMLAHEPAAARRSERLSQN